MKYSLISLMEYRFGIFPPGASEKILQENLDFEPILLSQSTKCDFEIKLRESVAESEFFKACAISALGFYFFEIRGFPSTEIEICDTVSNFKLKKNDKILLKPRKCKYEFTKKRLELQGVMTDSYLTQNAIIFPCENLVNFEDSVLKSVLFHSFNSGGTAIAYSLDGAIGTIKKLGCASMLESAVLLATLFSLEGLMQKTGEIDFLFDFGQKLKLKNLGSSLFEASFQAEGLGFFEYL